MEWNRIEKHVGPYAANAAPQRVFVGSPAGVIFPQLVMRARARADPVYAGESNNAARLAYPPALRERKLPLAGRQAGHRPEAANDAKAIAIYPL